MATDYEIEPREEGAPKEEGEEGQEAEPKTDPAAPNPDDAAPTEKANLARFMTEEQLKGFSRRCIDRYQRDVASRAPRMKKLKELQEMYAMVAKPKSFPYSGAANVRTPTVAGPNLQIQARLFDMMIPASGDLFNVLGVTADERELAFAGEQFGNTYIRYDIPQFEEGFDDLLHQVCLYGSGFRRTYGNGQLSKVCSDTVPIDDFVVAYGHRSKDPSMSDVEFYTYVHRLTVAEIKEMGEGDSPVFINTDKVSENLNAVDNSEFRDSAQKIDGVDPDEEFAPHQVLECHCKYKLPNAPGKHPLLDGKSHFLVIHIDWPSEQVLRVAVREEDDPDDARRFQREMAKVQEYQQELERMTAAAELAAQPKPMLDQMGQPMMDEMGAPMMQAAQPQQPMQPPPAPPTPKPVRKRQVCFFTHYRCFPISGFYGLGYGDILYGLAMAKNTIINQHIDGVTLKNAKPMFMSRQVRMQRGNVPVRPGEVIEVDGPVNQIRDAIMFLDPPGNDPTTVPLIQMLDSMSDILVGSADMMTGQVPKSNQALGSIQIMNEEAMKPITVLGRRLMKSFEHELYKIWRCFGVFLTDDQIADIMRDSGNPAAAQLGRQLFVPSARLVPAADPRTRMQRAQEFQQLAGFVAQSPVLGPNPGAQRELAVLGLKQFPDGARMAQYLPPEQPQPPPPPPPSKHWEEEAGWLKDEDKPVHPDDDDDEHLQGHLMFLSSEAAQTLQKPARDMAERHVRHHHAQRLTKGMSQIEQQRAQMAGPNGQGSVPMAGPPTNAPILGSPS